MGHDGDTGSGTAALDGLVSDIVDTRRRIATLQAKESRLLADAVELAVARMSERRTVRRSTDRDMPMREISLELGAAMRVSDRTVQARMGDASALVSRFAATLGEWEAGRLDAGHVGAILDAGTGIADDETRADFERRMLEIAANETPTRLRSIARAVAASLDPEAAGDLRHGGASRRVRVIDLDDGLARLIADLPAALAYAILDRLTQMGSAVREADATDIDDATTGHVAIDAADPSTGESEDHGDESERTVVLTGPSPRKDAAEPVDGPSPVASASTPPPADLRTMDQLRADILADLLLAGAPAAHGDGDAFGSIKGHVRATVPVLTLAGVRKEPALLTGYGPIDPETARRLAAKAPGWDRVMTHPCTGAVLAVDRYRPSAALDRFLVARDEQCRTPGCTRPAHRCDRDHTVEAARGGPTSDCNLCHFCRRHHTIKGVTPWSVRQLGGGVIEWTSPTGRRYLDRPPATVRFVPIDWAAEVAAEQPPF